MSVSSEADPEGGEESRGLRACRRSSAARSTGPARPSTPMTRLRRQAMTLGRRRADLRVSSAKVTPRTWSSASMPGGRRAGGQPRGVDLGAGDVGQGGWDQG